MIISANAQALRRNSSRPSSPWFRWIHIVIEKQNTTSNRLLPSRSKYLVSVSPQFSDKKSRHSKVTRSGREFRSRALSIRIGSRSTPSKEISGWSWDKAFSRKSYRMYARSYKNTSTMYAIKILRRTCDKRLRIREYEYKTSDVQLRKCISSVKEKCRNEEKGDSPCPREQADTLTKFPTRIKDRDRKRVPARAIPEKG